VTSFFRIKGAFSVFIEKDKTDSVPIFFHGLGENTCSLQAAYGGGIELGVL